LVICHVKQYLASSHEYSAQDMVCIRIFSLKKMQNILFSITGLPVHTADHANNVPETYIIA